MECKSLRESAAALTEFQIALYAASVDKPAANRRFAEKLELPYPILSDPGKKIAKAYGVLRVRLFAVRETFIIGADGKLLVIDRDVRPRTAGEDLLAHLERLEIPKA